MVRPLIASLALSTLAIAGSAIGCDSISKEVDRVIPTSTQTPVVEAGSKASKPSPISALEQSIHRQVNQYRKSRKLPPLTLNARITQQARLHSQAMAAGRVPFSHNGFERRVKVIEQSIRLGAASENLAYNKGYRDPAKQAVQGWIKSPGHQKNMVGQYDLTGIGVAKNAKGEYYLTQIFIKRQ